MPEVNIDTIKPEDVGVKEVNIDTIKPEDVVVSPEKVTSEKTNIEQPKSKSTFADLDAELASEEQFLSSVKNTTEANISTREVAEIADTSEEDFLKTETKYDSYKPIPISKEEYVSSFDKITTAFSMSSEDNWQKMGEIVNLSKDVTQDEFNKKISEIYEESPNKKSIALLAGLQETITMSTPEQLKQEFAKDYVKNPSIMYSYMISNFAGNVAQNVALTVATGGAGAPAAIGKTLKMADTLLDSFKLVQAAKTAGAVVAEVKAVKPFIPYISGAAKSAMNPNTLNFVGVSGSTSAMRAYADAEGKRDYFHDESISPMREAAKAALIDIGINQFGFGASGAIHTGVDRFMKTNVSQPIWTKTMAGTGEAISNVTQLYATELAYNIDPNTQQNIEIPAFMYIFGGVAGMVSGAKMAGQLSSFTDPETRLEYIKNHAEDLLDSRIVEGLSVQEKERIYKEFSDEAGKQMDEHIDAAATPLSAIRNGEEYKTLRNLFESTAIKNIALEATDAKIEKNKELRIAREGLKNIAAEKNQTIKTSIDEIKNKYKPELEELKATTKATKEKEISGIKSKYEKEQLLEESKYEIKKTELTKELENLENEFKEFKHKKAIIVDTEEYKRYENIKSQLDQLDKDYKKVDLKLRGAETKKYTADETKNYKASRKEILNRRDVEVKSVKDTLSKQKQTEMVVEREIITNTFDDNFRKKSPAYAVKESYNDYVKNATELGETPISFKQFVLDNQHDNPSYLNFIYGFKDYWTDFETNLKKSILDENFSSNVDLGINENDLKEMKQFIDIMGYKELDDIDIIGKNGIYTLLQKHKKANKMYEEHIAKNMKVDGMLSFANSVGYGKYINNIGETLDNLYTATMSKNVHSNIKFIKSLFRNIENFEEDITEQIINTFQTEIYKTNVDYTKVRNFMDMANNVFYAEGGVSATAIESIANNLSLTKDELQTALKINTLFSEIYNSGEISNIKNTLFQSDMIRLYFTDSVHGINTKIKKNEKYFIDENGKLTAENQTETAGFPSIEHVSAENDTFAGNFYFPRRPNEEGMKIIKEKYFKDEEFDLNVDTSQQRKIDSFLSKDGNEKYRIEPIDELLSGVKYLTRKDSILTQREAIERLKFNIFGKIKSAEEISKNIQNYKSDMARVENDIKYIKDNKLDSLYSAYKAGNKEAIDAAVSNIKNLEDLSITDKHNVFQWKEINKIPENIVSIDELTLKQKKLEYEYNLNKLVDTLEYQLKSATTQYVQPQNKLVRAVDNSVAAVGNFLTKFVMMNTFKLPNRVRDAFQSMAYGKYFNENLSALNPKSYGKVIATNAKILSTVGTDIAKTIFGKTPKFLKQDISTKQYKTNVVAVVDKLTSEPVTNRDKIFKNVTLDYFDNNVQKSTVDFYTKADDVMNFNMIFSDLEGNPKSKIPENVKDFLRLSSTAMSEGMTLTDLSSRFVVADAVWKKLTDVIDNYSKQVPSKGLIDKDNLVRLVDEAANDLGAHMFPGSSQDLIKSYLKDYFGNMSKQNVNKEKKLIPEDVIEYLASTEQKIESPSFQFAERNHGYLNQDVKFFEKTSGRSMYIKSPLESLFSEYLYSSQHNINFHYNKYNQSTIANLAKKYGKSATLISRFISYPLFSLRTADAIGFKNMQKVSTERKYNRAYNWMVGTASAYIMYNMVMDDNDKEKLDKSPIFSRWIRNNFIDAGVPYVDAVKLGADRLTNTYGVLETTVSGIAGTAEEMMQLSDFAYDSLIAGKPDAREELLYDLNNKNKIVKNDLFKQFIGIDLGRLIKNYGEDEVSAAITSNIMKAMGIYEDDLVDGAKLTHYENIIMEAFISGINDKALKKNYYSYFKRLKELKEGEKAELKNQGTDYNITVEPEMVEKLYEKKYETERGMMQVQEPFKKNDDD